MRGISLILFLLMFFVAEAQYDELVTISLPSSESKVDLGLSGGRIDFDLRISSLKMEKIFIEGDAYVKLSLPGYFIGGRPGEPSLPQYSALVEKGGFGSYNLTLERVDSVVIDLDDYYPGSPLVPVSEPVQKNGLVSGRNYQVDKDSYHTNDWYSLPLAAIEEEGRMREVNIGRFFMNPVRYHPRENKIIIFYRVSGSLLPAKEPVQLPIRQESLQFERILSSLIREEKPTVLKKVLKSAPVTMVILSDTIFRESLQPLIEWKRKKGFMVIEAYTDDPGVGKDRASIKSYLSDLYHTPAPGFSPPSFLLIAGDVQHVPLSQGSGQTTDLYYTTYDGVGDYLPDLFQGRIAVKNKDELEVVVNKILEYEQYEFPDPGFLAKSILIAGNDASYAYTHGNGQINYAAGNYFNSAHNIDANIFLHPEASSSDAEILAAVSEGAALVNYTGHGESYGWLDPAFRTSHIPQLTNKGKYPLLIGNGCSTNVFDLISTDCFAEAVVKAENRGAIAYIGCTNDSYWDEDFYWSVGIGPIISNPEYAQTTSGYYDKVFHEGAEPIEEWAPSLGEMIFAGNMTVQQSNSGLKQYYWEIYQLMGDPSLVPWFAVPADPDVVFPDTLAADASEVVVEADPYDYIALSSKGELLDAKHADEFGMATLGIPVENRGDTLLLVVTGDQRQPLIRQIPDIGFLKLTDLLFSNETVLPDGIISNGEEASISVRLTNASETETDTCRLLLSCSDSFVTLIDSVSFLPSVAPGDTLLLENAFSFKVDGSVEDQSEVLLNFIRNTDFTSNNLRHSFLLHSPELSLFSYSITEGAGGNGNRMLEAGEDASMIFDIINKGDYFSDSVVVRFSDTDTLFQNKLILKGKPLDPGESARYSVSVTIPDPASGLKPQFVEMNVGDGNYELEGVRMFIGKYLEDFSSGLITHLPWVEMDWYRDTSSYFYGPASLRSAKIGHRQSSSAEINVHLFETDSVSFNFRISSEAGYDYLKFYVDDTEINRWSGTSGWSSYTHQLSAGLHSLKWSYTKDNNTDSGEDAAWIDNILFPADAFIADLYIDSIIVPREGPRLGDENIFLELLNIGLDTIFGCKIRYNNNQENWEEYTIQDLLIPGKLQLVEVPGTVDLSEVREHMLQIVVRAEEDAWPWNDTLSALIDHYEFPDLSIEYQSYDTSSIDFIDLVARIENNGNITIPMMNYTVTIDGEFSFSGRSRIDLEPGTNAVTSLNLINEYYDWLETGWHDYMVEIEEDSVMDNNSVEGSIHWIATGARELQAEQGFHIYPNPASEILFIEMPDATTSSLSIVITDALGQEVFSKYAVRGKCMLTLPGILAADGMYNLRIMDGTGGQVFSESFIYTRNR